MARKTSSGGNSKTHCTERSSQKEPVTAILSEQPLAASAGLAQTLPETAAQGITERKRMRDAIQDEAPFVSAILETVGALIVVLDTEGRIVRFNRACEEATGYSFAEVRNRVIWEFLLVPEEIEPVKAVFEKLRLADIPNGFENYWVTKSGAHRLISWSNTVLQDSEGTVTHVIATGIDITEQKRAEQLSRDSERKFRFLANSVPALFSYIGADEHYKFVNNRYEEMLGLSRGEILGRSVREILGDSNYQKIREKIQAVLSGQSVSYEWYPALPGNEARWINVQYEPVLSPEGEVVGFFSLATDVTDSKRAEEALRKNEREFHFFADNVPGLFSYVDSEQRYRFINKSYEKVHALPQEQIIGKHVRDILGDKGYELAREHIQTALSGQGVVYEAAFPLRCGLRWMIVRYVPDLDENGKAKGFFTLVADITERKKAEEALRLSQDQLRALAGRLISAKEDEAKRIARELHDEFGQRLAVINLRASELAGILWSHPESAAENLQAMIREIGSVAKALHDLSHHLHPAVLSQLGLVMALEAECATYSQHHGIAVEFSAVNIPELLPEDTVLCLYRVTQEGLQNIGRHAQANRAMVTLDARDGEIVLTVQDFGNGFDLDAVRGKGGLGLVSMAERVRLVGGSIDVHSKLGQGTQIAVRIPMGRS